LCPIWATAVESHAQLSVCCCRFWKELGELMSRLDEDNAYVDILRPRMTAKQLPVDVKSRRKSDLVAKPACSSTVSPASRTPHQFCCFYRGWKKLCFKEILTGFKGFFKRF